MFHTCSTDCTVMPISAKGRSVKASLPLHGTFMTPGLQVAARPPPCMACLCESIMASNRGPTPWTTQVSKHAPVLGGDTCGAAQSCFSYEGDPDLMGSTSPQLVINHSTAGQGHHWAVDTPCWAIAGCATISMAHQQNDGLLILGFIRRIQTTEEP